MLEGRFLRPWGNGVEKKKGGTGLADRYRKEEKKSHTEGKERWKMDEGRRRGGNLKKNEIKRRFRKRDDGKKRNCPPKRNYARKAEEEKVARHLEYVSTKKKRKRRGPN